MIGVFLIFIIIIVGNALGLAFIPWVYQVNIWCI